MHFNRVASWFILIWTHSLYQVSALAWLGGPGLVWTLRLMVRTLRGGGHGTILCSNVLFTLSVRKVTIYTIEKLGLLQKDSWRICVLLIWFTPVLEGWRWQTWPSVGRSVGRGLPDHLPPPVCSQFLLTPPVTLRSSQKLMVFVEEWNGKLNCER